LKITQKIAKFKSPLYLESGRILEPYQIAYESYGQMNEDKSNVIVITHALAGNQHAAGTYEDDRKAGWWDDLIGDGKAIDTTKHYVIVTNVLGSSYGSTSPMSLAYPKTTPFRFTFPVITIKDMVKAQKILFGSLGIYKVKAIVGGSMGGMQALQFGVDYPNFAKYIFSLASTAKTRDLMRAYNKITSESILKDPEFKNGNYKIDEFKDKGLNGLAIGRMAGHISFLSHQTMESKFKNEYSPDDGLYDLFGKFQVDKYLEYNAYKFSCEFDPLSYLYIQKAINIFDLSRGYENLNSALKEIKSKL
jgi:homoserine O-acetyltransferase